MIKKTFNNLFYFIYDFNASWLRRIIVVVIALILFLLGAKTVIRIENTYEGLMLLKLPFEWVSSLIKSIALLGDIGNIIAIIIWVVISSLPLIIYLILLKGHPTTTFKLILHLIYLMSLSILIGVTIYYHINPTTIPFEFENFVTSTDPTSAHLPEMIEQMKNSPEMKEFRLQYQQIYLLSLSLSVLFFMLLYFSIRFYLNTRHHRFNLFQASTILLTLVKVFYLGLFLTTFFIIPMFISFDTANIDVEVFGSHHLETLLLIKYLFIYISILFIFMFTRNMHDLMKNFTKEKLFDESNVSLLHTSANVMGLLLITSVLNQLIYNGYQIINNTEIQNFKTTYNLPLVQIILALVFYLLSLLMSQSYKIYRENSLTI